MIATEEEYKEAMIAINDLRKQYNTLSQIERSRPYCGPQMLRMIHMLTQELRTWENDRFKKLAGAKQD